MKATVPFHKTCRRRVARVARGGDGRGLHDDRLNAWVGVVGGRRRRGRTERQQARTSSRSGGDRDNLDRGPETLLQATTRSPTTGHSDIKSRRERIHDFVFDGAYRVCQLEPTAGGGTQSERSTCKAGK